jgi:hypothetical protein
MQVCVLTMFMFFFYVIIALDLLVIDVSAIKLMINQQEKQKLYIQKKGKKLVKTIQ